MTTEAAKKRLETLYWLSALQIQDAFEGEISEKARDTEKLIGAELSQIADPQAVLILSLRYQRRWPFKEIARAIHYSVRQTRRLHDQALEAYAESLETGAR